MTDSQRWREKDERLLYADRQMVSLTVSRGLPLHTPLHPPPPISVLPVIHCALTSTPSLSSSLSSSCSHSQSLSSFHACLLCWLHVKCQVRSQLTDPLWHVRWCKTSKVMSSLPPASLPPSPGLSAMVRLLLACWEASRPSVVSKELLGWNPPSKDTWQLFIATRDRTSTDPTVVPPLLVSSTLSHGHPWVTASFDQNAWLGLWQCLSDLKFMGYDSRRCECLKKSLSCLMCLSHLCPQFNL